MRIRLGLKTHKGTLGAENEDRFLIGMDPASNDWLYSPEEIAVGEFGTLILLADGLGNNGHGSKAANLVCHTIKKLFDEMLEIPPDQEGLLLLLRKFFIIANQQLILKTQENPDMRGFGCSATMVLMKDHQAYIVWAGNCRAYRFSRMGVAGSYFCEADQLEQLNVDHQIGVEKKLLPGKIWPEESNNDQLTIHFGMKHQEFLPGMTVVQLHAGEKLMICTEGLFGSLQDMDLAEALTQDATPDVHSEDLITKSFNADAKENISVIIAEVLNGPLPTPVQKKDRTALKIKAISLLGHDITTETPPVEKNQDHSSGIEPGTKDFKSDIRPMKVRTVLPDDSAPSNQDLFFTPTPKKEEKPEEILPPKEKTSKISAIENALKKEHLLRKLTPTSGKDRQPERDDLPVSKSKPRIMATAYPDPDDLSETKRQDQTQQVDNVEENPPQLTETEVPSETDLSPNEPVTPDSEFITEEQENEFVEQEEIEEDELDYEDEEPGDPYIAGATESMGSEASPREHTDRELDEDLDAGGFVFSPDPEERELNEEIEESQEDETDTPDPEFEEDFSEKNVSSGSYEETEEGNEIGAYLDEDEENEKGEDEGGEYIVEDQEIEASDDPAEDLIIPSIYADEMVAPLDSFQSDEDKESPEEIEDSKPPEPEKSSEESISTQKAIPIQSATKEHISEPLEEPIKEPVREPVTEGGPPSKKGGLGIRIMIILVAVLLLGLFICNQMGSESMEDLGLGRVDERSTSQATDNQSSTPPPPIKEDTPQEESTADINRESVIPETTPKPAEPVKEEKPKEVVKEKEPERLTKEPDYDDRIKENKQQLTGEVEALLKQKNALCRQIDTYQKNAPSKKQDKIKELVYDCDQLEKKFISIYDSRSGFFKTVRYDLLSSTINNIKFSIEQTEKKFEGVRSEQ